MYINLSVCDLICKVNRPTTYAENIWDSLFYHKTQIIWFSMNNRSMSTSRCQDEKLKEKNSFLRGNEKYKSIHSLNNYLS